jgi:uncharacterized protein YgbK (DUF1537 family)
MIAVIADDLTGAAEIAGIGLRYQLKSEIVMPSPMRTDIDLLIVCTDSRSLNNEHARKVTAEAAQKILLLKPGMIFKKIDSVYRGHVLDELRVQMKTIGLDRALLLAANPSLGRTIRNGKYYINDQLINETGFATDPEFAITTPDVLEMVGASHADDISVLRYFDKLPARGIVIGEASTMDEISEWSERINNQWVLAGAGDFFTALLQTKYALAKPNEVHIELPHLYISGTSFVKSKQFIKAIGEKNDCVLYMPSLNMHEPGFNNEKWLDKLSEIIRKQKRAVIAINDEETSLHAAFALELRTFMAKAVRKILEREKIKEVFIEGGSTAGAILHEMKITSLEPVNELKRGVVRMKAKDLYITMKPGSYDLPPGIIELYN